MGISREFADALHHIVEYMHLPAHSRTLVKDAVENEVQPADNEAQADNEADNSAPPESPDAETVRS